MTSISPLSNSATPPSNEQKPSTTSPKMANTSVAPAPVKAKPKPRKRVNTAEKRHQHNAIERARRETLNSKFLTLARLLPSLANHRRPSKSAIVNGSISHISNQREQRLLAASLLRQICSERDELFEEVNEWRKANGLAPREGSPNAWNDDMEEVCSVEKEVFGNFASMGGEDDGDDEIDMDSSVKVEDVPQFVVPTVNGLITPRSSTDIDPMSHPMFFQAQQQHRQQMPQHLPQPPTVNMHGVNWSQDFANQFQHNAVNPTPSLSNNTPLPFSAFMSDSTESPGTSNLGNSIMLTPPTTADLANNGIFTHTPSPRPSSAGIDDKSVPVNVNAAPTQQWTPQQLLFLQQIQQHQAQVRQHQQNLANHYSAFPGNTTNLNAANPVDGFTQSLINTMFPQQAHVTPNFPHHTSDVGMGMNMAASLGMGPGAGLEHVQQWRKAALTGFLQQNGTNGNFSQGGNAQIPQLRNGSPYQAPMLTPGGMSMGMNGNGWSPENVVEGF